MNRKIANDPSESQQLMFGSIAIKLGIDAAEVWDALSDGGQNGITIRVTEADRLALARDKDCAR